MKVKLTSDGTLCGTDIRDAETGEPLLCTRFVFDADAEADDRLIATRMDIELVGLEVETEVPEEAITRNYRCGKAGYALTVYPDGRVTVHLPNGASCSFGASLFTSGGEMIVEGPTGE